MVSWNMAHTQKPVELFKEMKRQFFKTLILRYGYFVVFWIFDIKNYVLWYSPPPPKKNWYSSNYHDLMEKYWYLARLALKITIIPYIGKLFLAITEPFFGRSDWNFWWKLRRLLFIDAIGDENLLFDTFWKKSYFWWENGRVR